MDTGVDVVACVDENYALPLAVMLASLDASMGPDATDVRVHVLHSGVTAEARSRVGAGLSKVGLEWLRIDDDAVKGAHFPEFISPATLYRLRIGELLPESIDRVLYLDADIVVAGSLAGSARLELGDAIVGAVRDAGCPWGARQRDPWWRELGFPPGAPYFNAGVLVIDLARWRSEEIGERGLEILRRCRPTFADQDALNVLLKGRWRELPRKWNLQTADLEDGLSWALARDDVERAIDEPLVVHYTDQDKPWIPGSGHPRRQLWFDVLERTDWAGWRPRRPRYAAWSASLLSAGRRVKGLLEPRHSLPRS